MADRTHHIVGPPDGHTDRSEQLFFILCRRAVVNIALLRFSDVLTKNTGLSTQKRFQSCLFPPFNLILTKKEQEMKNNKYWIGIALLTINFACQKQKEFVNKVYPIQEEVENKLEGKWEVGTIDYQPVLTDQKQIVTYERGWSSYRSGGDSILSSDYFMSHEPWKCVLYGNGITETSKSGQTITLKSEIETITSTTMEANLTLSQANNDASEKHHIVYKKIEKDFSNDILGLWEGKMALPGIPDSADHRWSFRRDGTYGYFDRDTLNDKWVENTQAIYHYIIDGSWLAFGKESSTGEFARIECWDINIEGDRMYWTALRKDSTGQKYKDQFELRFIVP